ncbi:uncharacterized protein B0H18DRAFT_1180088 [Fomitopsis serialis]|uniref:uncharacterized protein n=1 Tax=Fomitopsis serialis TaxID=139415 RepID=UPI002008D946|nr:uncharacterized protein B0H18DRAFT_1180088 [Neoantrodia serialis]KAH9923277.1 hypothetical protein B0H18DRAFT_1180088 [Neoantrodia serialis]
MVLRLHPIMLHTVLPGGLVVWWWILRQLGAIGGLVIDTMSVFAIGALVMNAAANNTLKTELRDLAEEHKHVLSELSRHTETTAQQYTDLTKKVEDLTSLVNAESAESTRLRAELADYKAMTKVNKELVLDVAPIPVASPVETSSMQKIEVELADLRQSVGECNPSIPETVMERLQLLESQARSVPLLRHRDPIEQQPLEEIKTHIKEACGPLETRIALAEIYVRSALDVKKEVVDIRQLLKDVKRSLLDKIVPVKTVPGVNLLKDVEQSLSDKIALVEIYARSIPGVEQEVDLLRRSLEDVERFLWGTIMSVDTHARSIPDIEEEVTSLCQSLSKAKDKIELLDIQMARVDGGLYNVYQRLAHIEEEQESFDDRILSPEDLALSALDAASELRNDLRESLEAVKANVKTHWDRFEEQVASVEARMQSVQDVNKELVSFRETFTNSQNKLESKVVTLETRMQSVPAAEELTTLHRSLERIEAKVKTTQESADKIEGRIAALESLIRTVSGVEGVTLGCPLIDTEGSRVEESITFFESEVRTMPTAGPKESHQEMQLIPRERPNTLPEHQDDELVRPELVCTEVCEIEQPGIPHSETVTLERSRAIVEDPVVTTSHSYHITSIGLGERLGALQESMKTNARQTLVWLMQDTMEFECRSIPGQFPESDLRSLVDKVIHLRGQARHWHGELGLTRQRRRSSGSFQSLKSPDSETLLHALVFSTLELVQIHSLIPASGSLPRRLFDVELDCYPSAEFMDLVLKRISNLTGCLQSFSQAGGKFDKLAYLRVETVVDISTENGEIELIEHLAECTLDLVSKGREIKQTTDGPLDELQESKDIIEHNKLVHAFNTSKFSSKGHACTWSLWIDLAAIADDLFEQPGAPINNSRSTDFLVVTLNERDRVGKVLKRLGRYDDDGRAWIAAKIVHHLLNMLYSTHVGELTK